MAVAARPRHQASTITNISSRRGYHHHQYHHHHRLNVSSSSSSSKLLLYPQHSNPQQQQHPHQRQQLRTVFISTENTPNPESIKFLPGTTVLDNEDGRGHSLLKSDPIEQILKSPLATSLFKIDGVKAIYYGQDFVSITKFATGKWQFMRPEIFSVLMDFFDTPDSTVLEDDDEIVAMIKELIEDRIRPAVQDDGGDILFVGCPSSSVTLKQGVENMLMHYIPEVTAVQALDQEPDEDNDDDDDDVTITTTTNDNNDTADKSTAAAPKQQKSYEERLAAAGIPFSD
eukprot:CAMPEP_0170880158 /NCGR_PEP_ID=MMETSP0734-20130129/32232_1 /TAXON_ID=186038 /ORGANISM="Fragilariopsis kerguelensis, Strain L26-C5" /LENGTH=285 /DNA_ID=CAMNT_0011263555 /DNA_START=100 /DNA_END=958 /DNA_ORIENTATION=-